MSNDPLHIAPLLSNECINYDKSASKNVNSKPILSLCAFAFYLFIYFMPSSKISLRFSPIELLHENLFTTIQKYELC